ncbi:MAG: hypothetical protein ACOCVF_03240 [bacterium]
MKDIRLIHTGIRIVNVSYSEYISKPWREAKVLRLKEKGLDETNFKEYAFSQLKKWYDLITLFVQAIYILSGKKWWIGKTGKKAEKTHVCSEFSAWCLKNGLKSKHYKNKCINEIIDKPWLVTAGDLESCNGFEVVENIEDIETGDIVVFHSRFMLKYMASWWLSWLAWIIRKLTKSYWNHAGVLILEK